MAKTSGGRAPLRPHLTALKDLLQSLAKRDTFGEIAVLGDGTRALNILPGSGANSPAAVATWSVFQDACDCGLLAAADEGGVKWVLSRAGRAEVRRLRSQSGDPADPGKPSTVLLEGAAPRVNVAESPLSWLRKRRDKSGEPLITAVQFDAGERLRTDFLFAEMTPRVTVNWCATGGSTGKSGGGLGIELRDNVIAAQQRVRRALAAIGPMPAALLIDVCGHLVGLEEVERARGWPPRSGKIALQMALSELARHYRIPGADEGAERIANRLRHWGVAGYRPDITPPGQPE